MPGSGAPQPIQAHLQREDLFVASFDLLVLLLQVGRQLVHLRQVGEGAAQGEGCVGEGEAQGEGLSFRSAVNLSTCPSSSSRSRGGGERWGREVGERGGGEG